MSTTLHAKFSASGSDRWLKCPGSIRLSEGVPESRSSGAALEGTKAHAVLEYMINRREKRGRAAQDLKTEGVTFRGPENQPVTEDVPRSMIVHAEMALDYLESRLKEFPGSELKAETRCALPVSEPGQFGTADAVITDHFGRLIVVDYKYGHRPVSPVSNSQMIYYALAVAHQYDYNFKDVELVILQPRAQVDGEWIRPWVTSVEHLIEWQEKFESGIQLAKSELPPLKPGDHCGYCPAAFKCPEIGKRNLVQAGIDFDLDSPSKAVQFPRSLDLAKVLPALDLIEVWIKAVRDTAFDSLLRGEKIPGFKLVDKRATRKWLSAEIASELALLKFGEKAFSDPELLSPAQLEKISKDAKEFVDQYSAAVSSGQTIGRDFASADFDCLMEEPKPRKGKIKQK